MESAKIWFETKLEPKGYLIFRGNLQSYTDNDKLFALGFISPFQMSRITSVKAYCLDATHCITKRSDEILYTIVIKDDYLGRGFPCAYMVTNDHSLGPIVQWLQFLKSKGLIVDPLQFTIDCSDAETNAINNIFPGCAIQYCLFHVSQAWNRQIALKVKSGGRPVDNRILRSEVHGHLKVILFEEDKERFHLRINEFIDRYETAHPEFINYFRSNWCNEAKYNVWSRAYHPLEFSHMLTNNYIESWHNQLKSVFLRRSRNKRLDRLIFILTAEVEYYYREEYDRVQVNHGPMTAAEKERRRVQLAAEAVPVEKRAEMITSPSGSTEHVDYDNVAIAEVGNWIVESFVSEDNLYVIPVDENHEVRSCSCFYFRRHQRACKHMHLLCLHVSEFSLVTVVPLNVSSLPLDDATVASSSRVDTSDETVSSTTTTATTLSLLRRAVDYENIMHHNNNDLLTMTYIDNEEAQELLKKYEDAFRQLQQLKDKYSSHFRTLSTQR